VAVLPPMTVMHLPKRPGHPKTPTNEEEARRNPDQKHHEERLHGKHLSFPNYERLIKSFPNYERLIKASFPCVSRKAALPHPFCVAITHGFSGMATLGTMQALNPACVPVCSNRSISSRLLWR
jgi:hypothetical protein